MRRFGRSLRLIGLATWGCLTTFCASASDLTAWTHAADALAVGLPALAYGVTGYVKSDTDGLKELTLGLAATVAASEVLKRSVPVTRPDGSDQKSFPSRHTAVAFAAARFLDRRYADELVSYRPALYAAAGMTALASVQAKRHRWGDTLAGAALGYGLAQWTSTPHTNKVMGRLDMAPVPGGWAVSWQHRW